jgi:hypothetical protein
MITDFLPKSSTLCFALSSKRLLHSLASLKSLREFKRFRLLQCVPNAFQPREDSSRSEQRQFLRLLSRDTAPAWVYCTDCVKLHPAPEFAAIQRDGSDVYGRCLMRVSYCGYIRVCPCWLFSCREIHQLLKKLQDTTSSSVDDDSRLVVVLRECAYRYSEAEIQLKITARFDTTDPSTPALDTEFHISGSCLPDSLRKVPQMCCLHRSTYNQLDYSTYV